MEDKEEEEAVDDKTEVKHLSSTDHFLLDETK